MTWVFAGAGGGGKTSGWEEWEACGRSVLRGESERHTSAVDGTVGIAGSGRLGVGVGVIVDNICSFDIFALAETWEQNNNETKYLKASHECFFLPAEKRATQGRAMAGMSVYIIKTFLNL